MSQNQEKPSPFEFNAEAIGKAQKQITEAQPKQVARDLTPKIEEFFIFYSFDMVNSTQFKTRYPQKWPRLTSGFFEIVERLMADNFIELPKGVTAKRWKYAGDEVLFYQKVTRAEDCDHALPIARKVLDDAIREIQIKDIAAELLSIKGAVWCARTVRYKAAAGETNDENETGTGKFKEFEGECRNIVVEYDAENRSQNIDFLGPEVDAGFRVAKLATRGRLLVSADLAYLYWKRRELKDAKGRNVMDNIHHDYPHYGIEDKPNDLMKVVAYEKLKGVWDGRSYPIVWFEKEWSKERIEETFDYDDSIESPFLKQASQIDQHLGIETLELVYKNRGQLGRMGEFVEAINALDDINEEAVQPKIRRAELHCAPIIISPELKILVAKRPAEKKFLPNCWEFGCGQLDDGQSIEECLKQTCLEDFGMEIDEARSPIPLTTFSFTRDSEMPDKRVPGLTFGVFCKPGQTPKRKKHAQLEWVDADNLNGISADQRVKDFDYVVTLAIKRAQEQIPNS